MLTGSKHGTALNHIQCSDATHSAHTLPGLQTTTDAGAASEDNDEFLDTMNGELIVDPVIGSDGNNYDRCNSISSCKISSGLLRRVVCPD